MTTYDAAASLMYDAIRRLDSVNRQAVRMTSGAPVFTEVSLVKPKLRPAELGLLRTVSWFYVLYFEAGKIGVDFLSKRLPVYRLDIDGRLAAHTASTHHLRTFFQHNLDPTRPQDKNLQHHCELWFLKHCSTFEPYSEDEWLQCLDGFLREACLFLDGLMRCIKEIEKDEARDSILHDWALRRTRYHPPHEFDRLIEIVANDMGRENLDAVRIRKSYYDRWSRYLELLQMDYDFRNEARKLIEQVLLSEDTRVLPITGQDIMDAFPSIGPGPMVGRMLRLAKDLYDNNPCNRTELLQRLSSSIEQGLA